MKLWVDDVRPASDVYEAKSTLYNETSLSKEEADALVKVVEFHMAQHPIDATKSAEAIQRVIKRLDNIKKEV